MAWGLPQHDIDRLGQHPIWSELQMKWGNGMVAIEQTEAEAKRDDLLDELRTFILLRLELMERGERLRKLVENEHVVGVEGKFYSVSRVYCPGAAELPVRVTPVTMLGES